MAYPQDLAGKFIEYKINPGGSPRDWSSRLVDGVLPGRTSTASLSVHECERSSKPPKRFQIVVKNLRTSPRWSFTFLDFEPGYVTTTPLTGPVLTGPMSGCYLCTYTFKGAAMVAHVGTYQGQDTEESKTAKLGWLNYVDDTDVKNVFAGNPLECLKTPDMSSVRGILGKPSIYGYFTTGAAYAIMLFHLQGGESSLGLNLHKVVQVKRMTMKPWSQVAALPTFKGLVKEGSLTGTQEIRRL
jgi:hypothetical protein